MKNYKGVFLGLMALPTLAVMDASAGIITVARLQEVLHATAAPVSLHQQVAENSLGHTDAVVRIVGLPNACQGLLRVEPATRASVAGRGALMLMADDSFADCVRRNYRRSRITNPVQVELPFGIPADSEADVGIVNEDVAGATYAFNPIRLTGAVFARNREAAALADRARANIAACATVAAPSVDTVNGLIALLPEDARAAALADYASRFDAETRRILGAIDTDIDGADAAQLRVIKSRLMALVARIRGANAPGASSLASLESDLSPVFLRAASRAGSLAANGSGDRDSVMDLGMQICTIGVNLFGDGSRLMQKRDDLLVARLNSARNDTSLMANLSEPMNDLIGRLREQFGSNCGNSPRPVLCDASVARLNRVLEIAGLQTVTAPVARTAVAAATPPAAAPAGSAAQQPVKPNAVAQASGAGVFTPGAGGAFQMPGVLNQVGGIQFQGGTGAQIGAQNGAAARPGLFPAGMFANGQGAGNGSPIFVQQQQPGMVGQQQVLFPQQQQVIFPQQQVGFPQGRMIFPQQQQVGMMPQQQRMVLVNGNGGAMQAGAGTGLIYPSAMQFQPIWNSPNQMPGIVGTVAGMRAAGQLGIGVQANLSAHAQVRL